MIGKKKRICIFDISNTQEDYARCLEFIKIVESKGLTIKEKQEKLEKLLKDMSVATGIMNKGGSYQYIERPMSAPNTTEEPESVYHRCITGEKRVLDILEQGMERHYHLRVHFRNPLEVESSIKKEFMQLQYLALLLRYFEDYNFIKGKVHRDITVFFVPTTGEEYPFLNEKKMLDCDTYDIASQYLRLLTKKYNGVIYGATKERNEVVVRALEFDKSNKYEKYFPLIIIDEKRYDRLFNEPISDEKCKELFAMNARSRYGESRDRNPDIAVYDITIETAMNRIFSEISEKSVSEPDNKIKMKQLLEVITERKNRTIMQLALFSFMFSHQGNESKEKLAGIAEYTWRLADEVSRGLKQIVQNSIQHSTMRGCLFSLCLHRNKEGENITDFTVRMQSEYPDTVFYRDENTGYIEALEVYISDLNDKEDMIENFCRNLGEEQHVYEEETRGKNTLIGHNLLRENHDKIAIRNFFSEYKESDAVDAWRAFRCQDMIAHVGLSLFKLAARRCKASVKVISSKECCLSNVNSSFYGTYGDDSTKIDVVQEGKRVVPGTQFSILIPIHELKPEKEKGIGQLQKRRNVVENYETFANYIDYSERDIFLTENIGNAEVSSAQDIIDLPLHITSAKDKYRLVAKWEELWRARIIDKIGDEKEVYCHDFDKYNQAEYFKNSDNIEVCIKGLIEALSVVKQYDKEIFLAFTHLPDGFVESFQKISVLFGVRSFPNNLQLFLCENDINNRLIFVGKNFREAIYNSYILSLEQGTNSFSKADYRLAETLNAELNSEVIDSSGESTEIGAFPFDAIIEYSKDENLSIFEKRIKDMAERPLDSDAIGYKLENTHMRLGSKVHIRSFYEMSFLFYRTTIANRIAFIMLRKLLDEVKKGELTDFDLNKDVVIFFGYASYSKAILTSVTEILRLYRVKNKCEEESKNVAFASYQHNLQTESEAIQMYFAIPTEFPGLINKKNQLEFKETVNTVHVIQVVPISSTLTTFDKMWNKFYSSVEEEFLPKVHIAENYTVFWVFSDRGNISEGKPSKIEENYWECVAGNKVYTKLKTLIKAGKPEICFFIRNAVTWEDPLDCDLCYSDSVLEEIPLVETDPTSTVPAQQIRYEKGEVVKEYNHKENNKRLLKLKECVYYGHIYRRQNHYQYYIDTQKFFNTVKDDVRDWLQGLGDSSKESNKEPILNIIFSPEHNTNVGFAQYVNTYYFGGLAEIVSINVDKEFRSNFICEHAALLKMIEKLYYDNVGRELDFVRFYFVDDTIISGETYEKANSFLHSLIPEVIKEQYPANLFRKVFLLVDRLSDATKRMYVDKIEENFLSFLHIDISNVRTQGDSCIGCKLEQNARRLLKRSATRSHSTYWREKLSRYGKIAYDNREEMDKISKEESYWRLLVSHVLQNIIVKNGKAYAIGATYDILLDVCEWFLKEPQQWGKKKDKAYTNRVLSDFGSLLQEVRGIEGFKILLKIICRPFFSFDSKIRMQVLTLYIFVAELLMSSECQTVPLKSRKETSKVFLYENERIPRTKKLADRLKELLSEEEKIDFLETYLFEGLTDMGSTYLMRLHTIKLVYQYINRKENTQEVVKTFWENYAINLQRLVDNNSDEIKELWLEYLYIDGEEYDPERNRKEKNASRRLYEKVTAEEIECREEKKEIFSWFCNEIFLQNTGIYFDGLEKMAESKRTIHDNEEYIMDYWKKMRELSQFKPLANEMIMVPSELDFFNKMTQKATDDDTSINGWYKEFLELICAVITERYPVLPGEMNIALVTESIDKNEFSEKIQGLDIVKEKINCKENPPSEIRYEIKKRIMETLENTRYNQQLEKNGYYVSMPYMKDTVQGAYIIIFFDNPGIDMHSERTLSKIERVFLYLDMKSEVETLNMENMSFFILRDILTYRNKIISFLERDFSGEIFAKYAHTVGEKNIVSHEKATSHNTTADDEITVEIFVRPDLLKEYEALEEIDMTKWLLLRNYTNGQIAKIFNRSFRENDLEEENGKEIPPLYVQKVGKYDAKVLLKQKLEKFSDLGIVEDKTEDDKTKGDNRFNLLQEIMKFKCEISPDTAFIQNKSGFSFNLEYFKCIILDICLSAIKYESDGEDYLIRVDQFLCRKKHPDYFREEDKRIECEMYIYREITEHGKPDYLVLRNPVDKTYHELYDWELQNEIIEKRLLDPLDFADGHMSLYAIKRYIENFNEGSELKCQFRYDRAKKEFGETASLYFETKLPVLKEI